MESAVAVAIALTEEETKRAVIIYMDDSFCQQLHRSVYSYVFRDSDGFIQDGMGCTSGEGLGLTMVHAITEEGPFLARDERSFAIREGCFKQKGNGKGKQG